MSAKQTNEKTAAPSTPAAAPAGSPPGADKTATPVKTSVPTTGADPETVDESDILSALGVPSEPPQAKDDEGNDGEVVVDPPKDPNAPAELEADAELPAETDEPSGDDDKTDPNKDDTDDAAAEVETDEAEEVDPEKEPEVKPPSASQKRINELSARSKSAEASLAKAQERLASFEAETSGRLDAGVLEHFETADALAKQRSQVVALHQRLLRNPQGIELPDATDKTKIVSYDSDGVAELLSQTAWLLHEGIPKQEQYIAKRDQYNASAETQYPWLNDSRTEQGAKVQAVLTANPGLKRIGPNYRLIAADALIGQTLREAGVAVTPKLIAQLKAGTTVAAAGKPVTTTTAPRPRVIPPAAPARAGTIPVRQSVRESAGTAADKRLSKGKGSVNDLAASIAARL
jgi:hypothetical protein